jgi:hypothetical protein
MKNPGILFLFIPVVLVVIFGVVSAWRSCKQRTILVAISIGMVAIPAGFMALFYFTPRVGLYLFLIFAGSVILLMTFRQFQSGVFRVGRGDSGCDRYKNPLGFWFLALFFGFVGLLLLVSAIVMMIIHPAISWR